MPRKVDSRHNGVTWEECHNGETVESAFVRYYGPGAVRCIKVRKARHPYGLLCHRSWIGHRTVNRCAKCGREMRPVGEASTL